ncbi:uncharacterized protein LOC129585496 [Paramacrobiotus metropolitanus]|uniref:uncharacterized protein LOC129585496 n=1 Tax=Paramacrobiotus metropolitanus TaxID=2943436 RepID=UPI002445E72C|nr:uncharacterized protein LOC129585496 [Paramacrobiotus metropolitanus]
MKRQRISSNRSTPAATSSSRAPPLRSSTAFHPTKPTLPGMSYKDLINAVGIEPETSPSSWRKTIDHTAETVVFFQVDVHSSVPSMCKSVRITQEHSMGERRLVPSVYLYDTLLSVDHVIEVLKRRYLADADDLMKLLEYVAALQADTEEVGQEQENGEDHLDEIENATSPPQPRSKRMKTPENVRLRSSRRLQASTRRSLYTAPSENSYEDATGELQQFDFTADASPYSPELAPDCTVATDSDVECDALPAEGEDDHTEEDAEEPEDSEPEAEWKGPIRPRSTKPEAARFTEEETRALIESIRANPILWRSDRQRANLPERTQKKRLAWEKVMRAVNRVAESRGRKKKTFAFCYKKWDSLLSSFRRDVRMNTKNGQFVGVWSFSEQMMFIKPQLKISSKLRKGARTADDDHPSDNDI